MGRTTILSTVAIFAAATVPQSALAAQVSADGALAGYTPVVIAFSGTLPVQGADAVIVRRAGGNDHDVILVRPGRALPETLAAAVGTLQAARARLGDIPKTDMLIRVLASKTGSGRIVEAKNWADRLVKSDASRQPAIDGLGQRQYVRVFIPNHPAAP